MKEILLVDNERGKIYVRKLYRDGDEFILFPRGRYDEWEASENDIKRISPQLWKEAHASRY